MKAQVIFVQPNLDVGAEQREERNAEVNFLAPMLNLDGVEGTSYSASAEVVFAKAYKGEKGDTGGGATFTAESVLDFPTIGEVDTIYIAKSENASYRWNDADLHYYCIGRDYNEIELIDGTI